MRLISLIIMFLSITPSIVWAQGQTGADYTQEYKIADTLITALKADNKGIVASLIQYPVEIDYPLPPIINADDFVSNWDDFFDKENIDFISKAAPEAVGDKGLMFASGMLWIGNGKVIAINLRSSAFPKKLENARKKEALQLHSSAQGYKDMVESCDTNSKHIRIQEHADGYHYFVWDKKTPLTEKPEITLKGDMEYQGTIGGAIYTFINGEYSYIFDAPLLCEEECQKSLTVLKGDKEVSRHLCK